MYFDEELPPEDNIEAIYSIYVSIEVKKHHQYITHSFKTPVSKTIQK